MQYLTAKVVCISIHAPHEGERQLRGGHFVAPPYFNPRSPRGGATPLSCLSGLHIEISIHAPHEGERLYAPDMRDGSSKVTFQSTLPTRGSDLTACGYDCGKADDFNPRSPRGGATAGCINSFLNTSISIHAPHEGERLLFSHFLFNSIQISIHAPHEGERH